MTNKPKDRQNERILSWKSDQISNLTIVEKDGTNGRISRKTDRKRERKKERKTERLKDIKTQNLTKPNLT